MEKARLLFQQSTVATADKEQAADSHLQALIQHQAMMRSSLPPSLLSQWSTMQHTIPPHSTTPLNTTNPVLLLTGHHLVLFLQDGRPPKELPSVGSALCRYTNVRCPGGALFKGDPQGTTATPSWCQETRGLRERPGSRPRSLVGSQLPTYPRQCQ